MRTLLACNWNLCHYAQIVHLNVYESKDITKEALAVKYDKQVENIEALLLLGSQVARNEVQWLPSELGSSLPSLCVLRLRGRSCQDIHGGREDLRQL